MRYSTLKRYHGAARALRHKTGQEPTRADIARELGFASEKTILRLGSDEASYVGCVHYTHACALRYKGLAGGTYHEMAARLGIRYQSVHQYVKRHPGAVVVTKAQDKLRAKYRAARDRILASGDTVTRKRLAYELKRSYKTVCTYLSDNPDMVRELGVIDTYGRSYRRR